MATKANRAVKKPEAPEVLWHGYFSLEEREAMIREAAYYRYLERGCAPGHDLDDWLAAEAELEFGRMAKTPAREVTKAKTDELEVQQSSVHGAAADDELKRMVRQHPERAIPRVESVEPEEAPFKE